MRITFITSEVKKSKSRHKQGLSGNLLLLFLLLSSESGLEDLSRIRKSRHKQGLSGNLLLLFLLLSSESGLEDDLS